MTLQTIFGGRQMQRTFFFRGARSSVALVAMNSFEHVGSMFEWAFFGGANSQNGGARRRKKQRRAQEQR